jgi:hypothetical protein
MRVASWLAAGTAVAAIVAACGNDDGKTSSTSDNTVGPTSTSAGAMTGSTSSTGGGGAAPIPCNTPVFDGMPGPCDLLQQDCPPGQQCDVVGNTTGCVTASNGLIVKGGDCSQDNECSAGLRCVDCKCTPYCCVDNDLPCEGGLCDISLDFGNGTHAYTCSFKESCTLFEMTCGQTPCGITKCHAVDFMNGLAVCDLPAPGMEKAEGEGCMYRNECGESAHCNTTEQPAVCRDLCDLTNWMSLTPSTGGCVAMRTCQMISGGDGFPNVGICLP